MSFWLIHSTQEKTTYRVVLQNKLLDDFLVHRKKQLIGWFYKTNVDVTGKNKVSRGTTGFIIRCAAINNL